MELGPEDFEERRKDFESPSFDWYKQRASDPPRATSGGETEGVQKSERVGPSSLREEVGFGVPAGLRGGVLFREGGAGRSECLSESQS